MVNEKSDKSNSVRIVDKDLKRMENLLSDQGNFKRVSLKNDAFLANQLVVNQKKLHGHHF